MADSKTQRLVEAAKTRMKAERELNDENTDTGYSKARYENDEMKERAEEKQKEAAEKLAEAKVQPRANIIDGEIDVEARGDVKGDGGDAKNYADDDPDKALGVPVYKHGLHETTVQGEKFSNSKTLFGNRISPSTQREMNMGKRALSNGKSNRKNETRRAPTRTTVTDADTDPDGDKGAEEAQRKAAETKANETKANETKANETKAAEAKRKADEAKRKAAENK